MSIKIKAVEDKIVVEEMEMEEQVTEAGVIVPSSKDNNQVNQEPQVYGKVISVGEKISTIKEGNIVAAARHGGQAFIWKGKVFKTYMLGEIFCVIEGVEDGQSN